MQYIATCATRILQSLQCVRAQYCNIYGLARERLPYIDHIRFPKPDRDALKHPKTKSLYQKGKYLKHGAIAYLVAFLPLVDPELDGKVYLQVLQALLEYQHRPLLLGRLGLADNVDLRLYYLKTVCQYKKYK